MLWKAVFLLVAQWYSGLEMKWDLFPNRLMWKPSLKSVKDTDGVYVVPAFAGLGAPHWDQPCPRNHYRTNPWHKQIAHCPGRIGEYCLSNHGCFKSNGS